MRIVFRPAVSSSPSFSPSSSIHAAVLAAQGAVRREQAVRQLHQDQGRVPHRVPTAASQAEEEAVGEGADRPAA